MTPALQEPAPLASERWFSNRWRAAMAWKYGAVCAFDFIIFPGVTQITNLIHGTNFAWQSLTLQNGGLYHFAMGAIVGVSA